MKYSDSVKAVLLAAVDDLAADPEKYAKRPGRDFTRSRKLGFRQLILMFLAMEGECIREEIYTFFGRSTDAPSKAAFYRQLQKLRDGALRCLLLAFNRQLKNNLFNGKYRLIACDGSALDIFRNPKDPDTFYGPSRMSPKGYNQAYINACYSILDRHFTDLVIQPAGSTMNTAPSARWWMPQAPAQPAVLRLSTLQTGDMRLTIILLMSLKTGSIS